MPILKIDSEAAELAVVGIEMLQAALSARVKRADPHAVISNSLILQANKLESVVQQMLADEPPPWKLLTAEAQMRIRLLAQLLSQENDTNDAGRYYEMLREILTASEEPRAALSLDTPLEEAEGGAAL